jgi:hypothetical protein
LGTDFQGNPQRKERGMTMKNNRKESRVLSLPGVSSTKENPSGRGFKSHPVRHKQTLPVFERVLLGFSE